MLALGSQGKTRHELVSKLFVTNLDSLKRGYSALLNTRNETDEILRIANTIFFNKNLSLRKSFKLTTKDIFNAIPRTIDFDDPFRAAYHINRWVVNKTDHAISSVIQPDQLEGVTLVLINAMYFKGNWNLRFNKTRTVKEHLFYIPNRDEHVTCKMMVMKPMKHRFLVTATFSMLELEFQDTDVKISFIKPYFNLTNIEIIIDSKTFFKLRKNLRPTLVELKIPKFNLGSVFSLKDNIKSVSINLYKTEIINTYIQADSEG